MKKNRCVVDDHDYDCYSFRLPLSIILKKRKDYLFGQLEKVHPGFSSDTVFRSRLFVNTSGVHSKVIVMNQKKLEEYKNCNPKKKIWISEVRSTFEEFGRIKNIPLLILILITGFSVLLFIQRKSSEDIKAVSAESSVIVSEQNDRFSDEIVFKNLLARTSEHKGKLKSLECFCGENTFYIDALIAGLYPEDFQFNDSMTNVRKLTYDNEIPEVSFTYGKKLREKTIEKNQLQSEQKKEIREIIFKWKGNILSEEVSDAKFKIRINNKKDFSGLVNELNNYFQQKNIYARGFSFMPERNGSICIEVELQKGSSNLLEQIIQNIDLLFFYEPKTVNQSVKKIETIKINGSVSPRIVDTRIKIGEIKRKDGTRILFYKNNDGKIIREIRGEL